MAGVRELDSLGLRGDIQVLENLGISNYNSLHAKLERRFTNGLGITTAFTYAKGMGYQTADDGGLQGFYLAGQGHRNWARNDFDRTFTFVQSYVYQLPFGKGKHFLKSPQLDRIVGGW